MSPSHAVGLERYQSIYFRSYAEKSLSHTVGLELRRMFRLEFEFGQGHHPTQWARNIRNYPHGNTSFHVTIPHGGLGTGACRARARGVPNCHHPTRWARNFCHYKKHCEYYRSPSHTVGSERLRGTQNISVLRAVTIPHGGLRTKQKAKEVIMELRRSPSHTVGSEPQITISTKIRHINHFVKVAPFSNEVNFPKSEIMQS